VSTLLQHYISVSAEATDYKQKWVTSTTELREILTSQESLASHVSELESQARLREERLTHTAQQMTAAQDNLQSVVREVEEARSETEGLRQQLTATQEALAVLQQREGEAQAILRSKTEEFDSQKHVFESHETESHQRVQLLETQVTQLQEELQAAQRNCAGAIHEREAMHEENKKLASVRVTLEGQLHSLEEDTAARQRKHEGELKQREDEIRAARDTS
jgi:chromosome segregation ATPase